MATDKKEKITIIIPAYNEAKILFPNIRKVAGYLKVNYRDFELILAEDGSTDGTSNLLEQLVGELRVSRSQSRLGRGLAISNAIRFAEGDIVLYMDADLATDLSYVSRLVDGIHEGYDICTGSRLIQGSKVHGRGILREFLSRGYNLLLRFLFRTSIKDHQCGFKAFRRSSILPLLPEVEDRHWFWDTELILRAQAKGMRVSEIPVSWTDSKDSQVRLWYDVVQMGLSAIILRAKI